MPGGGRFSAIMAIFAPQGPWKVQAMPPAKVKKCKIMGKFKGILYGMSTSVTFGLIPLFTLPLMEKGMAYDSILFYRFLFASIALACVMIAKKESFRISAADIPVFVLLAFFYTFSSLFLLSGYGYMGAGVATTLHFTYPVFVTLLMFLLFREKASWLTWTAIALAVGGVALLSLPSSGMKAEIKGIIIVLLSAVAYGSYIVGVNKSRVRSMNSRKLAFYVFVFTTLIFGIKDIATGSLQAPSDTASCINLLLLAVLPTVVSNVTLVLAVQSIGGTLTSVLGALEPLTAVCIGIFVFGEEFTLREGSGMLMILSAVTIIILSGTIQNTLGKVIRRTRPRHS